VEKPTLSQSDSGFVALERQSKTADFEISPFILLLWSKYSRSVASFTLQIRGFAQGRQVIARHPIELESCWNPRKTREVS